MSSDEPRSERAVEVRTDDNDQCVHVRSCAQRSAVNRSNVGR